MYLEYVLFSESSVSQIYFDLASISKIEVLIFEILLYIELIFEHTSTLLRYIDVICRSLHVSFNMIQ